MKERFEEYGKLVSFLKDALPPIYDVVLIDLTDSTYPILEQSNWSSANSEFIRQQAIAAYEARGNKETEQQYLVNGERLMKLNHLFIQEAGEVIGCLSLNMECDFLSKTINLLQCTLGGAFAESVQPQEKVELEDIERIAKGYSEDPLSLDVNEKRDLFVDLYNQGVFRLKGAVSEVSRVTGLSEKSVYRYLSEIRKARQ